jgi:hypothetical protein
MTFSCQIIQGRKRGEKEERRVKERSENKLEVIHNPKVEAEHKHN